MRKPIIGGNWKMNLGTPNESKAVVKRLIPLLKKIDNVDIVIAAPYTALPMLFNTLKNTKIKLGAQNMHYEDSGAFTGEISPKFLNDIGIEYVILGHSERRDLFNESDVLVNRKLKKALSMDLKPIVCIGEHLKERENGKTKEFIEYQFNKTFDQLSKNEMVKTVIAYEPIWAIGTGKTATPEQAEEIHIFIRDLLKQKFDREIADSIRIQYGGSIKPENAEELFKKENIDGGLVGGASLQPDSFYQIIKAAENTFS
ncbi:MAG: triose-phosphate isomerase [Promethearchaeota archaeon]